MERWVPLEVADCDPDPLVQFRAWFVEGSALVREPDAAALATADAVGQPRVRMVLLRRVDERGLGWFTNYDSRKGRDLAENPRASLLWYCEPLGRQVRVEGSVAPMSAAESDEYFTTRPRGHQLGAHASAQSRPLEARAALEARVVELAERYPGAVPRPINWGGYWLRPSLYEFWQHRSDRLHDRVIYEPDGAAWRRVRYAP